MERTSASIQESKAGVQRALKGFSVLRREDLRRSGIYMYPTCFDCTCDRRLREQIEKDEQEQAINELYERGRKAKEAAKKRRAAFTVAASPVTS